jgi:hypothetical protein
MLNPVHATTLGRITCEQQLGFFKGFALLLSLLPPVLIKELMGRKQIAPPEICTATVLANPLQLSASRHDYCRDSDHRDSDRRDSGPRRTNLGLGHLAWIQLGASRADEQQQWQKAQGRSSHNHKPPRQNQFWNAIQRRAWA